MTLFLGESQLSVLMYDLCALCCLMHAYLPNHSADSSGARVAYKYRRTYRDKIRNKQMRMTEHKRCRIVYMAEYVSCIPKCLTISTLVEAGSPQLHMWQPLESPRDYRHMCGCAGRRWECDCFESSLASPLL